MDGAGCPTGVSGTSMLQKINGKRCTYKLMPGHLGNCAMSGDMFHLFGCSPGVLSGAEIFGSGFRTATNMKLLKDAL